MLNIFSDNDSEKHTVALFSDSESVVTHFLTDGLDYLLSDLRADYDRVVALNEEILSKNPITTCIALVDGYEEKYAELVDLGIHEIVPVQEVDSERLLWRMEIARRRHNKIFSITTDNDFFSKMLDLSIDVVLVISIEGVILYNSPNIRRILGYDPNETVGKSVFDFFHSEDMGQNAALFEQILKSNEVDPVYGKGRVRSNDGEFLTLKFSGRNMLSDPDIRGIIVNYHIENG
ncbi:hypothetical protein CHISP_1078 [Chitinispirillum alkaliphilum]|nr:hypothetical protein CHISP_1078 [Chitinispirillum alkaliphilum]